MKLSRKVPFAVGGLGIALAAAAFAPSAFTIAADHLDPPTRTDPAMDTTPDRAADIADVYAWHTEDDVIVAMTFSGPQATTAPATYDPNVLYTINISNSGGRDTVEVPIEVRFGNGGANQFGVQVSGVPGVTGAITGSVETNLVRDGVLVRAGLFDDPFFFDLQGFRETARTGTLSFDSSRNFFAGQNLTAVVIQIPRERLDMGGPLGIWASAARFGGQL